MMIMKSVCFLLFLVLILCGCSESGSEDATVVGSISRKVGKDVVVGVSGDEVKSAYWRARASMLQEERVQVDVLWVLCQFEGVDAELKEFVDESKVSILNPHFIPGVFSDLPCVELPKSPDRGIRRLILYLQAAFGCPRERSVSWLQDFIATDESGYVLTHQFLVLIWGEQAGLLFSGDVLSRKRELLLRVYEEQYSVGGVDSMDLYMERVAILLMYGHFVSLDRGAVDKWMKQIVDLQLDDGAWPLSKTLITYDGESTVVSSPRSHTTALAMMALSAYIRIY